MDNEKIEFYKNRSFGERLSAAADFLRQNWKVFYKNILIPAIPLVLLVAFLLPEYFKMVTLLSVGDTPAILTSGSLVLLFIFAAICLSLYLYAMSGALMQLYEEGGLTDKTSWGDLSGRMFSNAGKIFLIGLVMFLLVIVVAMVAFLVGDFMASGIGRGIVVFLAFILIIGLIAAMVPLSLVIFPALFRGASTWESIRKSLSVGFKNWGSTFGVLFIVGLMSVIISIIFEAPFQFWMLFNPGQTSVVLYLLAILFSLASVFVTPFLFVFLAFQYFSITEKEEGVSLQNKIDEFDNL